MKIAVIDDNGLIVDTFEGIESSDLDPHRRYFRDAVLTWMQRTLRAVERNVPAAAPQPEDEGSPHCIHRNCNEHREE